MTAPTVEELREALDFLKVTADGHDYADHAENCERADELLVAIDELATLRASNAALVEALNDLLGEMSGVPFMGGGYGSVRVHHGPRLNEAYGKAKALAALTPKATTTKETT